MTAGGILGCAVLVGAFSAQGFAQDTAPMRRVRSEKAAIAALIEGGIARSRTFKELVEAIDRTDGLVYIEEGKCGRSVHACLALTVTIAGPNRILRILIDPRRPQRTLTSSIGHELRHAIEVLSNPTIRSNPEMFQFFSRRGPTARERFETLEAIRAGLDVCAELDSDK